MINLKIKLDDSELTEEQSEIIRKSSVEWVIANIYNDKMLIEAVVHQQSCIEGITELLAERNPIMLGGWKKDGLPLNKEYKTTYNDEGNPTTEIVDILDEEGSPIANPYPFNESEYLSVMPDIVEYDDEMNEISRTRPTEPKEILKFGGWDNVNFEV